MSSGTTRGERVEFSEEGYWEGGLWMRREERAGTQAGVKKGKKRKKSVTQPLL